MVKLGRPITLPDAMPRACKWCGEMFTPERKKYKQILCSLKCQYQYRDSKRPSNAEISRQTAKQRGDTIRGRGAGKSYIKREGQHEHRLIAAQALGRELLPGEVVHHIDGNRRNNATNNLIVLPSQGIHLSIHHTNRNHHTEGGDVQ